MEARPWHRFYEPAVPRSLDYLDLTVPQMLRRTLARFPGRPALVFRNRQITYRELDDQVARLATAMSRMGVGKGSSVAIHGPNLPHTVIAYFATLRLGAKAVMTNPLYMPPEIEHQWNDAGVTVAVVMDYLYSARVQGIRQRLGVEHYIVGSIPEYLAFPLNLLAPLKLKKAKPLPLIAEVEPSETVHMFGELIASTPPSPPEVDIDSDDVAMLQYTGGTTGTSKGAMLTHRNIAANVQQMRAWNQTAVDGKETILAALPFFHIYGLTVCMLFGVHVGGTLILQANPRDIEGIVKLVVKHKITCLPAVPAMFNGINHFPGITRYDLSNVKVCNSGSAPLPVDVLKRFEELTGAKISEGYGLTETSPVTHSNPFFGTRKVGSIGVPLPDTDCRIVDVEDSSKDVEPGEPGELLIRGPQVMKGYWQKPDETASSIRDDWFFTGDLARMDQDGFFYIVGRKKDMILASGYNVYPDEVDRVLMGHPAVLEAATIGLPDERRGETVKSFVVKKPGQECTADDLVAHCRENLAAYKVPREVEFRDALPKSTVLKILRRQLRDEEMEKRGAA